MRYYQVQPVVFRCNEVVAHCIVAVFLLSILGCSGQNKNSGSAGSGDTDAAVERFWQHMESDSLDAAEDDARDMLAIDSGTGFGYFYLGRVYMERRHYEAALHSFDSCLDRTPNATGALLWKSRALTEMCRFDESIEAVSHAIRIGIEDCELYATRAFVYAMTGDYEKSIRDYSSCLEVDSTDTQSLIDRSMSYRDLGQLDSAFSDLTRAANSGDSSMAADIAVAFVGYYRELKLIDSALYFGRRAVALDPNSADANVALGAVQYERHQLDSAILLIEKGVDEAPNSPYGTYWLAKALFDRGDYACSLKMYCRTAELMPCYFSLYDQTQARIEELRDRLHIDTASCEDTALPY